MAMAINGERIEEITDPERRARELRLMYAGAVYTLVNVELRIAAARLIAVYPLKSAVEFLELAREAFDCVISDTALAAQNAQGQVTTVMLKREQPRRNKRLAAKSRNKR